MSITHNFAGQGKGAKTPKEAPDSLFSNNIGHILDVLSEGEIDGVVGGRKGILYNEVPLEGPNGEVNFQGVIVAGNNGTPDQSAIPGFDDVKSSVQVNQELPYNIYKTISFPNGGDVTAVIITLAANNFFEVTKDGDTVGTTCTFVIERSQNGSSFEPVYDGSITGKQQDEYTVDYRVPIIDPVGNTSIRVKRTKTDTTSLKVNDAILFKTYTKVVEHRFSYPNLACYGHTIDAKQFGNQLPQRQYHVRGILCRVPHNYDPVTRAYTGPFNGSFTSAIGGKRYTNNPVYIFYEIVTNKRYGLGKFFDQGLLDIPSLYMAAKWCDDLVSDGRGGLEPRWTCNTLINTRGEAHTLLKELVSAFRGSLFWMQAKLWAIGDQPREPVKLVTNANVMQGRFSYSGESNRKRFSVYNIAWNDPDLMFRRAIETVEDPALIREFGYKPTDFGAFACSSPSQARRVGLALIYAQENEDQIISYSASFDHMAVDGSGPDGIAPGDLILIADKAKGTAVAAGRIKSVGGAVLTLDRDAGAAATGTVWLEHTNGTLEWLTCNFVGTQVTLTEAAIHAVEPGDIFILVASGFSPLPYVVLKTSEEEEHILSVTAVRYDDARYLAIYGDQNIDPKNYMTLPSIEAVRPVASVSVEEGYITGVDVYQRVLNISWPQPTDPLYDYVEWSYQKDNDNWLPMPSSSGNTARISDAREGKYKIGVSVVNRGGRRSRVVYETYDVEAVPTDQVLATGFITDLALQSGGAYFSGRDAKFTWRVNTPQSSYTDQTDITATTASTGIADPMFRDCVVTVRVATMSVRTESVIDTTFVYTAEKNAEDNGGIPARQFTFGVQYRDKYGRLSSETQKIVSNPAPAFSVQPVAQAGLDAVHIRTVQPGDLDYVGYRVYASLAPGVAILPANLRYTGSATDVDIISLGQGTHYLRVVPFDAFGPGTPSNEITAAPLGVAQSLQGILIDIADLETTYGSTVSSAASAAAAASSASAALGYSNTSQTASSNATTANTNAQTASQAAAASSNQSLIASNNAQTASTQAATARDAATTAQGLATTAANTASTQATNASGSATSAAGSASVATSQANAAAGSATSASGSANTATSRANDAAISATASASSAGAASSSATNAGSSASAASASEVSARAFAATRGLTPNGLFDQGLSQWFSGPTGEAGPNVNWSAQAAYNGRANVVKLAVNQTGALFSKRFSVDPARKYRVRVRVAVESAAAYFFVGLASQGAAGNQLTHDPGGYAYCAMLAQQVTVAQGWVNAVSPIITGEGTGTYSIFPIGTRQSCIVVLANYPQGGTGTQANTAVYLDEAWLEDVTESEAAATSASASAISASNAATSQTAAGNSASAAQTSATNAATSAGQAGTSASNASTSASQASTSASNASSSASSASTQAANAATSATAAAGSATAASGSASTATTQATGASNSATAALASQVSASSSAAAALGSATNASNSATAAASSQSAASTSATNAATSATSATTSANTASTQAANAATSATAAVTAASAASASQTVAGNSASAAQSSATSAATSAGSASTSAGSASTSATNAAGSANTASTQAINAANSATASAGSATAASGSASTASTQATNASNSATAATASQVSASSSAGAAAGSATAAAGSATAAAGSATASASSASAASTSVTNASNSATSATTQANIATAQAGNASTSATTASGSAANAAASATAANGSAASAATNSTLAATYVAQAQAYSLTHELTPNSDFIAGTRFWTPYWTNYDSPVDLSNSQYHNALYQGRPNVIVSASGEYLIFGGKPFAVDPARKYRVKGSSHANAAGLLSLFGLVFFDASKAFITNRYGESSGGALFSSAAGWTDFEALFLQSGNTGQGDIPPNAVFAQPFCLSNYTSAAGKIAAVDYLYGEDISQQVAVTSQAGIATSQASSASSSAALAQSSAVTSAAFSSSLNNKNAQFANWSAAAPALPNDWVYGVNNEGQTVAKVAGEVAGYAIDLTTPGSRNWEIYTTTPISSVRAGWYVMELDIDHVSGNWGGAGMRLVTYDASSNYLGVQTILVSLDKESSAQTILSATPTAGRYKFRKIVNITNALTSFVNVAAYGPGFGGGNANPGRVVFRKCGFRLATETEIRDQTVLLPMQSTVAVHTGALATLQGENTAYFQVEGNAGSDAAFFISARARASYGNAPSSSVSMGAREFHVYNQVAGSWRKAMSVVEGNAIFTGGLQAGTFIRLGGGDGWPVALRAKDYTVADGTTVSFGLDLGALPLLDFNPSGLAALAAGEAYQLYADGFTGTGFIARLKIATSGAATTYTLDADTAQGTGPTRQIDKASNPDANTGNYAFNVQGSATTLNYYEPEFQSYISGYGTVYVDIWVKKAGVWLKAAYASVFVEGNGSGVSSTSNWYLNETYQLGTGVQAFGVSVNSFDGSTSAASVQDLQSVMWTTTSVSGSRTATPSGQLGKVTVRPQ